MKKNTTLHGQNERINFNGAGNSRAMVWKVGLDVELRAVAVAIQCGRGVIGPAAKWTREQLIEWVKEKTARGDAVYTCMKVAGLVTPCTSNFVPPERVRWSPHRCD